MYFKPPQNKLANPFYYPLNEAQRYVQEAVTVDIEFKKDADGAAAVGSETGRRGLIVSGKKVRDKVYKITFTNNATMNKFMDKYENKLNEGTEEVEESTPAYRKMMKRYKGSDNEKVFNMLRAKGYKVGEQDDTLVQNLLKRHRGNVKKVVDQIVKDYPGKFDVERMMMDHVEIDEASVYKRPVKVSALGGQKFHAIVQDGKIVAAGMTEKEARKTKKFGQQVRELPGAKVGQLVKEDVEQVDEVKKSDGPFTVVAMKNNKVVGQINNVEHYDIEVAIDMMRKDKQGAKISVESKSGKVVHTEDVEQVDEMSAKQHYNKMVAQGKVGRGGRVVTPIDRKRFPNREKEGLEGPFRNRKSGQVYYYDKKAGKYYDPLSDMYLQVKDVMENTASYDINEYLAEEND